MGDVRGAVSKRRVAPRAKDEAGAARVQGVDLRSREVDIMHQQHSFPQKTYLGKIRGDRAPETTEPGDVLPHGGVQARGDLPSPIGKERRLRLRFGEVKAGGKFLDGSEIREGAEEPF